MCIRWPSRINRAMQTWGGDICNLAAREWGSNTTFAGISRYSSASNSQVIPLGIKIRYLDPLKYLFGNVFFIISRNWGGKDSARQLGNWITLYQRNTK
jgi:hypothetical protein